KEERSGDFLMIEILEALLDSIDRGRRAALASIVSGHGSLPMSRRSKMVVFDDGTQIGTVGGGCLEAEVHALSGRVTRERRAVLRRFVLTEEQAGAEGLNCGGTVMILVEPIGCGDDPIGSTGIHRAAREALWRRQEMVMATVVTGPESEPRLSGRALVGWKGIALAGGNLAGGDDP